MAGLSLNDSQILLRATALIGVSLGIFSLFHILSSWAKKIPISWNRLGSQILLYAVLLAVLAGPTLVFTAFLSLLILLGVREIYGAVQAKNADLDVRFLKIFSYLTAPLVPWILELGPNLYPLFLFFVTLVLVSYPIFTAEPNRSLAKTIPPALSLIFAALISTLLWIRQGPDGLAFTLLIVFLTNAADATAFVFGKILGKRPLAPQLSPGKTVEGTLAAILFAVGFSLLAGRVFLQGAPLWQMALFGILIGGSAHMGDLISSVYKRDSGIKDWGHLIPGHGGILDRFDSLTFSAPVFYFFHQCINGNCW